MTRSGQASRMLLMSPHMTVGDCITCARNLPGTHCKGFESAQGTSAHSIYKTVLYFTQMLRRPHSVPIHRQTDSDNSGVYGLLQPTTKLSAAMPRSRSIYVSPGSSLIYHHFERHYECRPSGRKTVTVTVMRKLSLADTPSANPDLWIRIR